MNVRNLLVVFIGLNGLAALSMPAAAIDGKTFPGSMCQPQNASQPLGRWDTGRTLNASTSNQWFDCPIVRDTMTAKSNGIVSAFAKVQDAHPSQNVVCEVWSQGNDGSDIGFSSRSSTGFNSSFQTLSFGSLASSDKGIYHLFCDIPATHANGPSGIGMYYVGEAE